MQEKIDQVGLIVCEQMLAEQEDQKLTYNQMVQPHEFNLGNKVLLLLIPRTYSKFLTSWQRAYTIMERGSPINYHLQQPGKHAETQLYHVNVEISLAPLSLPLSLHLFQVWCSWSRNVPIP